MMEESGDAGRMPLDNFPGKGTEYGLTGAMVVRSNERCIGKRHLDLWTPARRSKYLICDSARLPISVDERVTPVSDESDSWVDKVKIVATAEFTMRESENPNDRDL